MYKNLLKAINHPFKDYKNTDFLSNKLFSTRTDKLNEITIYYISYDKQAKL